MHTIKFRVYLSLLTLLCLSLFGCNERVIDHSNGYVTFVEENPTNLFEDQSNLAEIRSPKNFSIIEDKVMTIHFYGVPDYSYSVSIQDDLKNILFQEEIKPQSKVFQYMREITLEKIPSTLHGKVIVSARVSSEEAKNAWHTEHAIAFKTNSVDWLTIHNPVPYTNMLVGEELEITGKVGHPENLSYSVSDGVQDLMTGKIEVNQDGTFQTRIPINQLPANHLSKATLAIEDAEKNFVLLDFFIREKP
ncbi:hypothetical protein [Brevibacillus brevis]|uniref:hypothetical protein n=1 Tax=Brevibacillus brevis TaxID=1393 RepID=UPI0007D8AC49|nr:hypothetical protein [Brevibacillus brevis]